jgi:hypothetical protein
MTYNSTAFETAHKKFLDDATTLTDDDLAQFAIVDPKLAERARAKRAGFVKAETDDDRRDLARPATMRDFLDFVVDDFGPILATYRHKNAMLEERCLALEQRVLELEAQRVIADVNANH